MEEEVFIETDIEIGSVTGFSQYILNSGKLISLFAEIHDKQFTCKNDFVSIAEYVINILKNRRKSRVLLEYNKDTDKIISKIGSYNIQEIIRLLKKNDISIDGQVISINHVDDFLNYYKTYMIEDENKKIIDKLKKYISKISDVDVIEIKYLEKCVQDFKDTVDITHYKIIDNVNECLIESKLHKIVEPIDYRDYFFNSYKLYADDRIFMNMPINEIIKQFLYSYFVKKNDILGNEGYKFIDNLILNNKLSEVVKNKYINCLVNNLPLDDEILKEVLIYTNNDVVFKQKDKGYKEYIDKLVKYRDDDSIEITDDIKSYFITTYIPEIERDFKNIYEKLLDNKKSVKKNTIDMFKRVWMKVADFFVLREIFNDKREKFSGELIDKELIILIGNMHYYNIEKVLKNFKINKVTKQLNEEKFKQNCVKASIFEKVKVSELKNKIIELENEKTGLIRQIKNKKILKKINIIDEKINKLRKK